MPQIKIEIDEERLRELLGKNLAMQYYQDAYSWLSLRGEHDCWKVKADQIIEAIKKEGVRE